MRSNTTAMYEWLVCGRLGTGVDIGGTSCSSIYSNLTSIGWDVATKQYAFATTDKITGTIELVVYGDLLDGINHSGISTFNGCNYLSTPFLGFATTYDGFYMSNKTVDVKEWLSSCFLTDSSLGGTSSLAGRSNLSVLYNDIATKQYAFYMRSNDTDPRV